MMLRFGVRAHTLCCRPPSALAAQNRSVRVHRARTQDSGCIPPREHPKASWWPPLSTVVLMVAGGLLFDAWSSQKEHLWRWMQERWSTRVELRSSQNRELCEALLFWCAQRRDRCVSNNLSIRTASDGSGEDEVLLALGFGRHVVTVPTDNGPRRVVLTREIDESTKYKQGRGGSIDEVITLMAVGPDAHGFLTRVLHEALAAYTVAHAKRAKVFANDGGYWELLCWRNFRDRATMQLTPLHDAVLEDIQRFIGASNAYATLGVPWRRGYLLHGPPGTGKSSFISVAAGTVHAPIYLLSLRDPQLNDALLLKAVNSVPRGSLLVLEDIDAVAVPVAAEDRSDRPSGAVGGSCSLSGLLNALDGIAASEGRLLMMTANNPHVLPTALLRPGRIDETIPFMNLTDKDAQAMMQRFLGDDAATRCAAHPLASPAELQHALLRQRVYGRP